MIHCSMKMSSDIFIKSFKDYGTRRTFANITGTSFIHHFRDIFTSATGILTWEYSAPMMAKEIESLKKGQSAIEALQTSVLAWEKCLSNLQTSNILIDEAVKSNKFD